MPGDLALLLGAAPLVAQGRRALPPLADRVLLADVSRKHPGYFAPVAETPGFGEALFRLVRELRGAGYDLSELGPTAGRRDRRTGEGGVARGDPRRVRAAPLWLLRPGRRAARRRARPDSTGSRCSSGECSTCRRRSSGCCAGSPSGCRSTCISPIFPRPRTRRWPSCGHGYSPAEPRSARSPSRARRTRRLRVCGDRCSPSRRSRRSRRTARSDWCRRRTPRARCGRRRARALQWAREGVPFWEMAVAYRHGEAYLPLVEAVFVEAGIPVYLHEGSPLAERPIGRQTLGLLALFDGELSRQSVMDFLTDAKFPEALHDEYGGIPASRWDSLSREAGIVKGAEQWQRRLGAVQRGRPTTTRCPTGCASVPRTPVGSRRFIADLDRVLRERPARASWAEHLDYLQDLLVRYVEGADEVIVALRGLERFTALEAEVDFDWFLDVVERAIGTLRSEDVIDSRPGAFARAGRERRRGQLARRDRVRARVDPRRDRAGVPAAGAPGPDPARRRAREGLRAGAGAARAAVGARQRGGADLRARVRGGARAARRLLRAPRDRREPTAAAVGVLPRARLAARGRARVGRATRRCCSATTSSGSPATRSARRSGPGTRTTRPRSALRLPSAVSEPERDRTYLQARVTRPLAIATFERAQPSFARALEAFARTCSLTATRPGTARSDRTRWTRSRRCCPPDAPLSADLARGLCDLSAAVHARAAAARPRGRGARADGADRRAQPRQRDPPDLRALLRASGTARDPAPLAPEAEQRMRADRR